MNLEPIHNAASSLASVMPSGVIWPGPSANDAGGLLMPALAGVAAAFTVAIMLTFYFQTRYRSYRDMNRHGLVTAVGLSLLACVIYDMRNAALANIVKDSNLPSIEFHLQWKQATERAQAIVLEM